MGMGMGMALWEWEGTGVWNAFPHTSTKKVILPRDATQSAVMPQSVRPSVCPWRLGTVYQIGWNASKIISRPNSLRPVCGLTPTWAIWCNGNTPELGWNMGGVTRERKKPAISPKRCEIGRRLLLQTNRKSYTRFRLVPKSTTLDDIDNAEHEERTLRRVTKSRVNGGGSDVT